MLGYSLKEIDRTSEAWEKLIHPEDYENVMTLVNDHLAGKSDWYQSEHRLLAKSGKWKWILDTGKVFERDENGNPIRAVGTPLDITERKEGQEILMGKSITDPLTKVYNRRYFFDRLGILIEKYKREIINLSLAIIDIDFFKKINDKFGHQTGDFVLEKIAEILKINVRPYDILTRSGGEEFTILFEETSKETACEIIKRILQIVNEKPLIYEETEIKFTFSGGVSNIMEIENGNLMNFLIKIADERLPEAKKSGRNRIICE